MVCHRHICRPGSFDHWIICQHQIEIEVWPASAEACFQDERYCDPANAQVRFEAAVYNAPDAAVLWEVRSLDGGPGSGSIDKTGLYTAPLKDGLPSGRTEVIVATASADPLRKAYAYVTLIGRGPEPPPLPTVLLLPKRAFLYYRTDGQNAYIDPSNTWQVFRAVVNPSPSGLKWYVNGGHVPSADNSPLYSYQAPSSGSGQVVTIKAVLGSVPPVEDQAKVVLINYSWPGIV